MTDSLRSAARSAWMVVALLWVVALLNYFDRQLVTTMSEPIETELKILHARFALFSSVFLWVYGACSLFAGYVADKIGRKPVIVLSLLVWSAATLLTGFVRSFEQMLFARALMGVSEAFYIPAAVALIVDYHRGSTRSLATGLHLSGVYAGSILGGFGGWIALHFGWRTGFQAFGAIGVAYAIVLAMSLKTPSIAEAEEFGDNEIANPAESMGDVFSQLLTSKSFILLLIMDALVGAAFWTIRNWLPTFFKSERGMDLTKAGIYGTMAFNSAAFVGMLIASTISDRWSLSNPRARMWVPAIGFCVAAPCFFAGGFSSTPAVILGAVLIVGTSQGFLDANLMPALCTMSAPRHRATGYGLLNFVSTITGGVVTYIGGRLKDARVPFSTTFQYAAVLIFLAGLLLLIVKPKAHATHS